MSRNKNKSRNKKAKQFGQYRLLEKLATGGMGEIFVARHVNQPDDKPDVALKRILKHHSENTQLVKMFFKEASIISKLNHENIIRILDFGKEEDNFFMTMDHIKGVNLDTIFKEARNNQQKWNLKFGMEIVRQALEGIKHAHNLKDESGKDVNIVHLDLSPHNLMISGRGLVKILDFGISKATYDDDKKSFNALRGTYAYMSPEQCKEKEVDKRSDLFSLGIILYEMTTLTQLFAKQPSEFMILKAITEGIIPPPSNIIKNFPPELEKIIYQALETDPDRRFQSAEAFLNALNSVIKKYNMAMEPLELSEALNKLLPEITIDKSRLPEREDFASGKTEQKVAEKAKTDSDKENKTDETVKEEKPSVLETIEDIAEQIEEESRVVEQKQLEMKLEAEDEEEEPYAILTLQEQAEALLRHKRKSKILYSIFAVLFFMLICSVTFLHYQKTGWLEAKTGSTIYIPDSGTLYIDTKPEGATVFISSKKQKQTTPFEIKDLPLNQKISVEIVMPGYKNSEKQITLDKDIPLKALVVDLEREY